MATSLTQLLSLEDFLKLPYLEESPAWEYVDGVAIQKPMPKTRHSILQKCLLSEIDSQTDDLQLTLTAQQIFDWLKVRQTKQYPKKSGETRESEKFGS